MKPARHAHRLMLSYPQSLPERLYSILLGPAVVLLLIAIVVKFLPVPAVSVTHAVSLSELVTAMVYTLIRLISAYILALIVAVPLAMLASSGPFAEKLFLPIFDILESIPVLAFFPVLILFFVSFNFLNGAAIFVLFLNMLWELVFTIVGGLKIIPRDIVYASKVFRIHGTRYLSQVLLPSIFPQIITGSILAFAEGWNLVIVAEVVHVYLPNGVPAQDLTGIGSILVRASATGQTDLFVAAICAMVLVIALFNFFIWQKLLHYAQRFKFE